MKHRFKFILGWLFAGLVTTSAFAAASLSPTGISASPSSALPGDSVSFGITVNNADAAQFGPGANANFTILLTHRVTGATFTASFTNVVPTGGFVGGATVNPTTGQTTPGIGSFTLPALIIPISNTEAGAYRATVTLDAVSVGTISSPSFSVSDTVLTVTGKPDLQVTSLSYAASTTYLGGSQVPMTLTYTNNSITNGSRNVPYLPGIGFSAFARIQVVLSSNPTFGDADDFQLTTHDVTAATLIADGTFDNAGNPALNADGSTHTITWKQLMPGNFAGSYYVLAKIDSLNAIDENDAPVQTVNGNNVWEGNALNPAATLVNLLDSNFPATFLVTHGTGVATSAGSYSDNPTISPEGRYIAFSSDATNLIASDTNARRDVFVYDNQTGLVRLVSVSQQAISQGNNNSNSPAISGLAANGHYYVAFASDATNLIGAGDTNGFGDIFVKDIVSQVVARVSLSTGGLQANQPSFKPAISADGRFVVFQSTATNLVSPATATGVNHIFLRDRDVAGLGNFDIAGNVSTTLVDVTPGNLAGNGSSTQANISADGSRIVFTSVATNLDGSVLTPGRSHVYVRNRVAGTTIRGDVGLAGLEPDADSQTGSLSSDGRYVAFASLASNLVAGDTNVISDIFIRDITGGALVRASVSSAGAQASDPSAVGFRLGSINPTISADGRYVSYGSLADNLTTGDSVGQFQNSDANQALDIFVYDRDVAETGTFDTPGNIATTMVSVNQFGYQSNGLLGIPSTAASNIYPVISANGRYVAFPSDAENNAGLAFGATNLLPLDSNTFRDVFLFDRRTNVIPPTSTTDPSVAITSPGASSTVLVNTAVSVVAGASAPLGSVASVQFFVDGTSLSTTSTFPFTATWTPTAVGIYNLSALVTDSFGNQAISGNSTVNVRAAPAVGITSPASGATLNAGAAQTILASAVANNPGATITSVQFLVNNVPLTPTSTTAPYSVSWTPTVAGNNVLTAIATDSFGIQTTSTPVNVTVNTNQFPVVNITSPANGASVLTGSPIQVTANATDSDGTVTVVNFLVNNTSFGSSTSAPFAATFTPTSPGTYVLTSQAVDNVGNITTSAAVSVTVSSNLSPIVAITSPNAGAAVITGSTVQVSATASDPDGNVAAVNFFVNGSSIGTASSSPYSVSWTPQTDGVYQLSASATDNAGATTNSSSRTVLATSASGGVTVFAGTYQNVSPTENGKFMLASTGNSTAVFIGYSSSGPVRSYFLPGIPVSSSGAFSLTQAGSPTISGQMSQVAVSGNLGSAVFVGPLSSGNSPAAAGFYTGSLSGLGNSQLSAIVAANGAILVHIDTGAASDVGEAVLDSLGAFSATTRSGTTITGRINPATGFLTGSATGPIAGTFSGALASGGTFSDGTLRGLSTRGFVGTGASIMIAGFVVDGNVPKQMIVRGIGPSMTTVAGVLVNPRIDLFNSAGSLVASNDNWANNPGTVAALASVGLAPPSSSFESVLIATLQPGTYTAQLSGVGGLTGVGLVEVYDADAAVAYMAEKVTGISTRGFVNVGDGAVIAGFVVGGSSPKKVLVQGIGPSIASAVSGMLLDPVLAIRDGTGQLVRENDNWEHGNDPAQVRDAASRSGATSLLAGGLDSAVLITLPPGAYTAVITGAGGATGIALVNVYEVP